MNKNKKAARYGLWFYLITTVLAFTFPKQTIGSPFFVCIYLVVCLTFLYFIYFWNTKRQNNNTK